jgi:hypothetical protein
MCALRCGAVVWGSFKPCPFDQSGSLARPSLIEMPHQLELTAALRDACILARIMRHQQTWAGADFEAPQNAQQGSTVVPTNMQLIQQQQVGTPYGPLSACNLGAAVSKKQAHRGATTAPTASEKLQHTQRAHHIT